MACVPTVPITSVYPSGGDFATALVPMGPPAPGRFSTTRAWPSSMPSELPTSLEIMSVVVPGTNGKIMRTGFAGYFCATAVPGKPASDISATTARSSKRRLDTLGMHFLAERSFDELILFSYITYPASPIHRGAGSWHRGALRSPLKTVRHMALPSDL